MYEDYLAHHGIKGQKWGERRFQNPDGSLTPEGYDRYFGSGKTYSYNKLRSVREGYRGTLSDKRLQYRPWTKREQDMSPDARAAMYSELGSDISDINEQYRRDLDDVQQQYEKETGIDPKMLEANNRLSEAKKRRAQEEADRFAKSQAYKEAASKSINDKRGKEAQSRGEAFVGKLLGLGRKVVDTAKKVGSTIKDYATGKKKIFSSKQTITVGGPIPKTGKTTSKKTTITLDKNGITKRTTTRRR